MRHDELISPTPDVDGLIVALPAYRRVIAGSAHADVTSSGSRVIGRIPNDNVIPIAAIVVRARRESYVRSYLNLIHGVGHGGLFGRRDAAAGRRIVAVGGLLTFGFKPVRDDPVRPQLSVEHGLGRIGFQLRLASHSVDDIDRHLDVAFDDRVTFRDARDSLFGSLTVLRLHRFQNQRNGASQKTGQYD